MKKHIIILFTCFLIFTISSCTDNPSNPIQVNENSSALHKSASLFANVQFMGKGEVINSTTNSDNTYALLCKIYFDIKMDNRQIAKGGGNIIIPNASMIPNLNFKVKGSGSIEFKPKNSDSEWNIIEVQIDVQNGIIRNNKHRIDIEGATILGLLGMLEGGK